MVQTDYALSRPVASNGQLANDQPAVIERWTNREGSAHPFGVALTRHASVAKASEEFDAVADVLIGLALRSHSHDTQNLSGADAIGDAEAFDLLRKGFVYVDVEESVADGDDAFARFTSDGGDNTQLGTWRKSVDSNRARRVLGATFRSAASAGGVALLEVDFTQEQKAQDHLIHEELLEADAVTADTTRAFFQVPDDRYFILTGAQIRNETGLAAHAANYFNVKVQTPAAAVLANWSTESGQEGALVADTAHEMTLAALATRSLNPGSVLELFIDETNTATLPANTVVSIQGYYL